MYNRQNRVSLQTDLQEEVGWRKDPKTNRKKGPTSHLAPLFLVFLQLLADLAINFIPAAEGKREKNLLARIIRGIQELFSVLLPDVFS